MRDDDDGQVDGDAVSPFAFQQPFAQGMQGQPWLRGSQPPWHMWGNTQILRVTSADWGEALEQANQLVKISYKRPETWHWFFMAVPRFPAAPVGPGNGSVVLHWDLTFGHGRSNITIRDFETYLWQWFGAAPTAPVYSSQVYGPNRQFRNFDPPPLALQNRVDQIVAQDIQLQVRMDLSDNLIANEVFELEVSAYFSPKTHIRPDWLLLDVPPEAQFSGEEVGGR